MNSNNSRMFCRQCQETFGNTGCTMSGVCGKRPNTSALMDELLARVEDLAISYKSSPTLGRFVTRALFMTITNANFDDARFKSAISTAERLLGRVSGRKKPRIFDESNADLRSAKELIFFGLKGIAAYCHHAEMLGHEDKDIYDFIFRTIRRIAKSGDMDELTKTIMECGKMAVKAMALLDAANTSAYGDPSAAKVSLEVGKRPGILVSGHDLRDLAELLEQTKDVGIDIYTHGEMLPAHYYPAFRKYPHLKGNYGNAWHCQQNDFSTFNGAILMTTNCIVPIFDAYRDRIFTTGIAGYPGVRHIADRKDGKAKDFSVIIDKAKSCASPKEIERGEIVGGFAHNQVSAMKDKIIAAVKEGEIRKFVVLAGCDGRHITREYYSQLAKELPNDTIVLTAGCAKYRFIKNIKGEIAGVPRVLDAGQCNDSYSLVIIALALKEALGVDDVNKLPLAFDIAWYEQKAVAVLLALLSMGFHNIRLGPTLPAFLSSAVKNILVQKFGISTIGDVKGDIKAMMG